MPQCCKSEHAQLAQLAQIAQLDQLDQLGHQRDVRYHLLRLRLRLRISLRLRLRRSRDLHIRIRRRRRPALSTPARASFACPREHLLGNHTSSSVSQWSEIDVHTSSGPSSACDNKPSKHQQQAERDDER
jgi:hypothetical protein